MMTSCCCWQTVDTAGLRKKRSSKAPAWPLSPAFPCTTLMGHKALQSSKPQSLTGRWAHFGWEVGSKIYTSQIEKTFVVAGHRDRWLTLDGYMEARCTEVKPTSITYGANRFSAPVVGIKLLLKLKVPEQRVNFGRHGGIVHLRFTSDWLAYLEQPFSSPQAR